MLNRIFRTTQFKNSRKTSIDTDRLPRRFVLTHRLRVKRHGRTVG